MRKPVSPLHGACLPMATLLNQSAHWQDTVLGMLCFSSQHDEPVSPDALGMPSAYVPMPRLEGSEPICEIWRDLGGLRQAATDNIRYRYNDELLFGVITLAEDQFGAGGEGSPLQQAAESAYRQIFSLLDNQRYPHLLRCWNYIADINGHSFGLERYRQFNLGRQQAFIDQGRDVKGSAPAACALGSAGGPLTIAFLAGRTAPRNIENPRQVSAYHYPPEYGPRSPTFSRASLVQLRQKAVLFISGTASIVGHATLHPTDVVAQTRETMANIAAVIDQANRTTSHAGFSLARLHYKVYVRHSNDLAPIRDELRRILGDNPAAVYLQADICRADLLVEIEATGEQSLATTPARQA